MKNKILTLGLLSLILTLTSCGDAKNAIKKGMKLQQNAQSAPCSVDTLNADNLDACEIGMIYGSWSVQAADKDNDPVWFEINTSLLVTSIKTSQTFVEHKKTCSDYVLSASLGRYFSGKLRVPTTTEMMSLLAVGLDDIYPIENYRLISSTEDYEKWVDVIDIKSRSIYGQTHPEGLNYYSFCVVTLDN